MAPRAAKVPIDTYHRHMESSSLPSAPLVAGEPPYILVGQLGEDACLEGSGAAQAPHSRGWVERRAFLGVQTSALGGKGPGLHGLQHRHRTSRGRVSEPLRRGRRRMGSKGSQGRGAGQEVVGAPPTSFEFVLPSARAAPVSRARRWGPSHRARTHRISLASPKPWA